MSAVSVSWSEVRDDVVRVRYPSGVDLISWDLFRKSVCVPKASSVHTYYDSGPDLIGRLADLQDAGYINRVTVRATRFVPGWCATVLDTTSRHTLDLWRHRTEIDLAIHPVVVRLSPYAPHGMAGAWADVIIKVFDPRWYLRPDHPDRLGRLESAFALTPGFDRDPPARRDLIRSCWVGKTGVPSTDPQDFFGRRHSVLLAAGIPEPVAVRKVGRLFLRAAVAAWLHRDTGGDPLFDPTRLFDTTAVASVRAIPT